MIGKRFGNFVIERPIASGGMGSLWLAKHTLTTAERAIKLLRADLNSNPIIVSRFVQEAKACMTIRHKALVQVQEVAQTADGQWFIVMDYLGDMTLARMIVERGRPFLPMETLRLLSSACDGLKHAHAHHVVHRDLKPDNMLVVKNEIVLVDWGISKALDDTGSGPLTKTAVSLGTPAFMAPEQMRDASSAGPEADLWAMGCVAYQMLTGGRLPFQLEDLSEYYRLTAVTIFERIVARPPTDPREHVPSLSERVSRVILQCLERDPAMRIARPGEFVVRLAEAIDADDPQQGAVKWLTERMPDLVEIDLLETMRAPSPQRRPPPVTNTLAKYELIRELGSGGMAEVFLAYTIGEEGFKRVVAVKRVLRGLSENAVFASMFIAEARVASHLHHANIVAVLDFERDAEKRLFLVMEYVDGRDLNSLVARGHIPISTAIYVIAQVLRALSYAHDLPPDETGGGIRCVIHRDVSPQNILLSWDGVVKLTDFGIAKALGASDRDSASGIKGKVSYMAPEQVNSEPQLDGRLDLYALGIVFWELLTGQRLYEGDTKAVFAQILFRDPPPPTQIRPDLPADIVAVTTKLLARDRERRYASAKEALTDLLRCQDAPKDGPGELAELLAKRFPAEVRSRKRGGSVSSDGASRVASQHTAVSPNVTMIPPPITTLDGIASQTLRPGESRRWRGVVVALAAAIVVGGAVGGVMATRTKSSSPTDDHDGAPGAAPGTTTAAVTPRTPPPPLQDAAVVAVTSPVMIDASVAADAATPIDAQPDGTLRRHSVEAKKDSGSTKLPAPAAEKRFGTLDARAFPVLAVSIDGTSYGDTPKTIQLPIGRHVVRLVNADLGYDERVSVDIQPHQTTRIERIKP